jgi:alkylated DNA repair dioxygenase AlkB
MAEPDVRRVAARAPRAMTGRTIAAGIALYPAFLPDADALFDALRVELDLRQEYLSFGARRVAMPRLTAWYGDPGARYTYSRLVNEPQPWTTTLAGLRARLVDAFGAPLNSCLANLYEDERSSMGWHADNERELDGLIVSVSFGATRTFLLREGRRGAPAAIALAHGSVLTMTVESQHRYSHAVPKEPAAGPRLNLTFRHVMTERRSGAARTYAGRNTRTGATRGT